MTYTARDEITQQQHKHIYAIYYCAAERKNKKYEECLKRCIAYRVKMNGRAAHTKNQQELIRERDRDRERKIHMGCGDVKHAFTVLYELQIVT
jgi:hypothetical protein